MEAAMEDGTDIEDGEPENWPRPTDRTFIEVQPFRGAWAAPRTDERLYRMIKGFHEAGDLLVTQSLAEPRRALDLLYPAIFAYRQSLELRLKYLLLAYGPLAGEKPDYRQHSLTRLWTKCRRIILFFEDKSNPPDRIACDAVERLISEFDDVDPGSDAFRFAHDTKGGPIELAVSEIDLSNLGRVVASIHNFLECVDYHLHYGYGVDRCAH
jgi:hypothetical protein